jgi:hypothetical protein
MKGHRIYGINAFSNPLRFGLIHETGGAVAQGTGIPTGITANTGRDQVLKVLTFFFRTFYFNLLYFLIRVDPLLFLHGLTHHVIVDDRVSVKTKETVVSEEIFFLEGLFEILPNHGKVVSIFDNIQNFPVAHGHFNRTVIDHGSAGYPDDKELFTLDLVFKDVSDYVSRITTIGHNADLVRPLRDIGGQIQPAMAIPMKEIHLGRIANKDGFIHHGDRPFFISDKDINGSIFE